MYLCTQVPRNTGDVGGPVQLHRFDNGVAATRIRQSRGSPAGSDAMTLERESRLATLIGGPLERTSLVQGAPLIACLVWAAMLAWWFWGYLDAVLRRRPGESVWQALVRANTERKLNQEARATMFGSRWATCVASMLCIAVLALTAVALARAPWVGAALCVYLIVGLIVIRRYNLRAHVNWSRLAFNDRIWFRLAHAWLWPLHLLRSSHRTGKPTTTTEDSHQKE